MSFQNANQAYGKTVETVQKASKEENFKREPTEDKICSQINGLNLQMKHWQKDGTKVPQNRKTVTVKLREKRSSDFKQMNLSHEEVRKQKQVQKKFLIKEHMLIFHFEKKAGELLHRINTVEARLHSLTEDFRTVVDHDLPTWAKQMQDAEGLIKMLNNVNDI